MQKFFVTEKQVNKNIVKIEGGDVNHLRNVLRANLGEKIQICIIDIKKNYICEIKEIQKKYIKCKIIEEKESEQEPTVKVSILQGLPKAEKMEFIIQKSVELGAYDVTPVEMSRSVVKLNENNKIKKIQRWRKIAEVASKQCKRDIIPEVKDIKNIKQICNLINEYDILFVAYENEKNTKLKEELKKLKNSDKKDLKIAILIGPEGGITEQEIDELQKKGAKVITLGKRILRTETVALTILSVIMYELDW